MTQRYYKFLNSNERFSLLVVGDNFDVDSRWVEIEKIKFDELHKNDGKAEEESAK